MANTLTTQLRGLLAQQGQTLPGGDDDLTLEIGRLAETELPELFQRYPDFASDYRAIREANAPSTLGGIVNVAKSAFDRSRQALNVAGGIDVQDAEDIAAAERRIRDRPVTVPWEDWQRAEGVEAVKTFLRDPIEITSNIIAAGFAGSLPALAGGVGAGYVGAKAGGLAGAVGGGPVGAAAGGTIGGIAGAAAGTGAGSLAVEYGNKYLETLQEAGADLADPESILRVVANPEVAAKAAQLGLRRGLPVAAFDAASAGLAGKFLIGLRGATTASRGARLRSGLAEAGLQGALGGGGEVAGALSAGEPISPKAIFEEVVGELGPGAVEVGAGLLRRPRPAVVAPVPAAAVTPPVPDPSVPAAGPAPVVAPEIPVARRVAVMSDEAKQARLAELQAKGMLTPDEQREGELLRALLGVTDAPVAAPAAAPVVSPPVDVRPAAAAPAAVAEPVPTAASQPVAPAPVVAAPAVTPVAPVTTAPFAEPVAPQAVAPTVNLDQPSRDLASPGVVAPAQPVLPEPTPVAPVEAAVPVVAPLPEPLSLPAPGEATGTSVSGTETPAARVLPEAGTAVLYREGSASDALNFIDPETSADLTNKEVFLATTPELALGQKGNQGVVMEFGAAGLSTKPNRQKPGLAFSEATGLGTEQIGVGNSQEQYRQALQAVEFNPKAMRGGYGRRLLLVTQRLESEGWTKTEGQEGRVRWERPNAARPPLASETVAPDPVVPETTERLEERVRQELEAPPPFAFGLVDAETGITIDEPGLAAMTPEVADRLADTLRDLHGERSGLFYAGDKTSKGETRTAVRLMAPDGTVVLAGLLPTQTMAAVGAGPKSGTAVQAMAVQRKGGKQIQAGGNKPALLSDVLRAGYQVRGFVHFAEAPGRIFQRFPNEAVYQAAFAATPKAGTQAVAPQAERVTGPEMNEVDALQEQLARADDPVEQAELRDEIRARGAEPVFATAAEPGLAEQASRAQELAVVAARLRHVGAKVEVIPQAFFQQSLEQELRARLARADVSQGARQRMEQALADLDRVRGVTYDTGHIAVGLDDVANANTAGLIWLLHEAGHALLGREAGMQGRVLRAAEATLTDLRAQLAARQQRSGVREARLDNAEEVLVSTLAQKLAAEGIPESPSLARAVWQWVKDLYFRLAMAVQEAFGREPSPGLALSWFENQVRRVVGGDYAYALGNLLAKLEPESVATQLTRQTPTGGTPGGIPDYYDPVLNRVVQPQVRPDSTSAVAWNLRFFTEDEAANPGTELEIPHREAMARIQGAALNEVAELAQGLYAQAASAQPGLTFEQWWTVVAGNETPQARLAALEAGVPGAAQARIGGERMTGPMNAQAWVEAKALVLALDRTAVAGLARAEEQSRAAERDLETVAKRVNKLEGDLRNAALHEANFREQLKAEVERLVRDYRAALGQSEQAGALAQAVRDAEGLIEGDPLPPEYEAVFRRVLADEIPLFDYVDAIAKLDLPLADLTAAEFYQAIADNAAGDAVLAQLSEPRNRPLLVALRVLTKKQAQAVDLLALRRAKAETFLKVHGDLKAIREAPEARLRELLRTVRTGRKATTFADRIRQRALEVRATLRAKQRTIQEAERRSELLAAARTGLAEKLDAIETQGLPAPSAWQPVQGETYLAMQENEDGTWQAVRRSLTFTREGPPANAAQLLVDLAGNRRYLKAEQAKAGAKTYQLVKRQTDELGRIDVERKYPEVKRLWFEKFLLPSADMILSGGGAGAAAAARMMKRFQAILFANYESRIFTPSLAWANRLKEVTASSKLGDQKVFLREVYDPVLYFLGTEPGLEEGPALREAVKRARRRLGAEPDAKFGEQFKAFLRETKALSETFVTIAEENGVFIEDPKLGGELRRAIARGWLTALRRMDAATVSTILGVMDGAGWRLEFKDAQGRQGTDTFQRGVAEGRTVVRAASFDGLMPDAAPNEAEAAARTQVLENPDLFAQAIQGFFPAEVVNRWLVPFINKPGEPVLKGPDGEPIDALAVQAAWQDAGGNVAGWIERLGEVAGLPEPTEGAALSPAAAWRAGLLRQLNGLYQMEARLAADASQVKNLFDPSGRPAHLLMDARENDRLPPEHIEHMGFDPVSSRVLLATLAFHAAFGRNGATMEAALAQIKGELEARRRAFQSLNGATEGARKRNAQARGLDYAQLQQAAKVFQQVQAGEEMLKAQFGFGNQVGQLGDLRGGLEALQFLATQITNNPKTGLLNLLQVTQRAIARRTLDPVMLRDSTAAGGQLVKQFFGSQLEGFGLHLLRGSQYAEEVGAALGAGYGDIPFEQLMGIATAKRGEELPTAIQVGRTITGLQRKGVRVGFGEAREFPRYGTVPFLANTMQSIGLAAALSNGTAEANSVASLVQAAVDYFKAHPEALNDPTFRLKAKDLRAQSAAWFASPGSFEYFRRALVDYDVGPLEQVAREAMARTAQGERLLTREQVLKVAMMAGNELDLSGSINTNPGIFATNPIVKFATPLLGWPLRQMNQIHNAMREADGRASLLAALRALGILAVWSLPVGLAFTFLTDEYDERFLKKKSQLGGIGGERSAQENATAVLQRLSRAGNIYGLGADFVSTVFAGYDPTSGQRPFTLDSRILAFSQLRNLMDAMSAWINAGFPTYASVWRPLAQSMGGASALHAVDIFNGALGLDNQQARLTHRTNVFQWLRTAGREAGVELARGGGGVTAPTAVGTWTREMFLAALANDRLGFLDAYRRAVDAAREAGEPDPEKKVRESWRSRSPLTVFKTRPSDREMSKMLGVMNETGQQAVRDALRLYERYTDLIAPSEAERQQQRRLGQAGALLRRQLAGR